MASKPHRARLAAAACAALIITGCSGGNAVFEPTITEQHAAGLARQILQGTAEAITPRPALETYQPGSGTGPCLINPADTSDKRVQVTLTYFLRGIPRQENASVARQILAHWKHQGYAILTTHHLDTDQPVITAATHGDSFLLSLDSGSDGSLSIGTSSPCIWPDGTPPPAQ
jgi:hypothetical protein